MCYIAIWCTFSEPLQCVVGSFGFRQWFVVPPGIFHVSVVSMQECCFDCIASSVRRRTFWKTAAGCCRCCKGWSNLRKSVKHKERLNGKLHFALLSIGSSSQGKGRKCKVVEWLAVVKVGENFASNCLVVGAFYKDTRMFRVQGLEYKILLYLLYHGKIVVKRGLHGVPTIFVYDHPYCPSASLFIICHLLDGTSSIYLDILARLLVYVSIQLLSSHLPLRHAMIFCELKYFRRPLVAQRIAAYKQFTSTDCISCKSQTGWVGV